MPSNWRAVRIAVILLLAAVSMARCSNPGAPSSDPPPSPSPPIDPGPFVLVGAGDIAICGSPGPQATATLLDGIPGTVFTAGDNTYPSGRMSEFQQCYEPTWGRHLGRTRPTPGNHDYGTAGAGPYYEYFGSRAGPSGLGYYSYRLGPWLILALNSEVDSRPGSAQMQWLTAELATKATPCMAAIWHRPLFTSGPNGENRDMQDFWRVLYEFGVEFIINGHDHLYERFTAQDPTGRPDPAAGIRQFTVGTGGVDLYHAVGIKPNSRAISSSWGVIKFTLTDGAYQWEFIPAAGFSFRDSGNEICH
jgi:acid phosphatase type 7